VLDIDETGIGVTQLRFASLRDMRCEIVEQK
jgi:hypothetical protein